MGGVGTNTLQQVSGKGLLEELGLAADLLHGQEIGDFHMGPLDAVNASGTPLQNATGAEGLHPEIKVRIRCARLGGGFAQQLKAHGDLAQTGLEVAAAGTLRLPHELPASGGHVAYNVTFLNPPHRLEFGLSVGDGTESGEKRKSREDDSVILAISIGG